MAQTGSRRHPHSCPVVFPPSLEVSSNDAGACLQILSNFQTLRTEKGTKIRGWAGNDDEAMAGRLPADRVKCPFCGRLPFSRSLDPGWRTRSATVRGVRVTGGVRTKARTGLTECRQDRTLPRNNVTIGWTLSC